MGKRSKFERREADFYPMSPAAMAPLIPYLLRRKRRLLSLVQPELRRPAVKSGIRRLGRTALYWVHTPMNRTDVIERKTKSRGPIPP
jgi:hypothetical protein